MAGLGQDIRGVLVNLRKELEDMVEVEYGLLVQLLSRKVLDLRHYNRAREKTPSGQLACILDLLTEKNEDSVKNGPLFLESLKATNQEHVANYIEHNGQKPNAAFTCWPLDSFFQERITTNMSNLAEMLELDPLVTLFWSRGCISNRQKDELECTKKWKRCDKLLNMLLKRSVDDYYVFVECLEASEQSHLSYIFLNVAVIKTRDFSIAGESDEIKKRKEEAIASRFNSAIKLIDPVIDPQRLEQCRQEMFSVVHRYLHPDMDILAMRPGHSVRCYFLCRSEGALRVWYEAVDDGRLVDTMLLIFNKLIGDKETVELDKVYNELNFGELQMEFVKDFGEFGVFSGSKVSSQASTLPCRAAAPGNSGTSVFDFKENIWKTYDVLEPIILRVAVVHFNVNQVRLLLPLPGVKTLATISSVCRDWWDVITGRRFIRRRLKLTFRKSTLFPTELLKATVRLRCLLTDDPRKTRDADVIVLSTLSSVCRRWKTAVFESGAPLRQRVQRLFHYDPQLLFTLDTPPTDGNGDPHYVAGVAILDNCLYVVYRMYDKVEVFDCEDRFKKVKDIEVEEMKQPGDMVGCSVTSRLFIIEWLSDVILRVDAKTGVYDKFIELGYRYASLALTENRLLMTSHYSLLIYDIYSGEKIKNIPLTGELNGHTALHAIESRRDSFFLSHRELYDNNSTVSEIDSEGRVLQVFHNDEKLLHCEHLALDSEGRLLVADFNNYRAVLIDGNLNYRRVLLDKKRLNNSLPFRFNYSQNNNRLTVGLSNGRVKIFDWRIQ